MDKMACECKNIKIKNKNKQNNKIMNDKNSNIMCKDRDCFVFSFCICNAKHKINNLYVVIFNDIFINIDITNIVGDGINVNGFNNNKEKF